MVIKIHQTVSTEKAFYYNERKVEQGEAVFFHAANTLSKNPFVYSQTRRLKEFLDIEKQNQRIKNKCLHISVNPSQTDISKLTDDDLRKEIQNFMDHMGYGNQPYLVYKHQDLDRVHFHIVSTRVDKQNGKKIKDNNERRKVQNFIKDLELKYQLSEKTKQEGIDFKFSPHSRNIKQSLESLFYHINQMSEVNSKAIYDETLKLFKVEIRKSGRGHIVVVTDDEGKPIRYPIRLSKFKVKPNFYRIDKKASMKERGVIIKDEKFSSSLQHEFIKELLWQIRKNDLDKDVGKKYRVKGKFKRR